MQYTLGYLFIFFAILLVGPNFTWEAYLVLLVIVFLIVVFLAVNGFQQSKRRRRVEDIPTTRIATGAVGSDVEIHGKVVVDEATALTAPLSGKPCAGYSLHVYYTAAPGPGVTVKTAQPESITINKKDRFYVDDGSGAYALVNMEGTSTMRGLDGFTYGLGWEGHDAEFNLETRESFLKEHPHFRKLAIGNDKITGLLVNLDRPEWRYGVGKIQVSESILSNDLNVYVMGYAQSTLKKSWKPRLSFNNFLKAKKDIEANEALASRFDTNRDGKLDPDELEEGARTLGLQYESEGASGKDTQRRRFKEKVKMVFEHSRAHPLMVTIGTNNLVREIEERTDKDVKEMIWAASLLLFLLFGLGAYQLVFR